MQSVGTRVVALGKSPSLSCTIGGFFKYSRYVGVRPSLFLVTTRKTESQVVCGHQSYMEKFRTYEDPATGIMPFMPAKVAYFWPPCSNFAYFSHRRGFLFFLPRSHSFLVLIRAGCCSEEHTCKNRASALWDLASNRPPASMPHRPRLAHALFHVGLATSRAAREKSTDALHRLPGLQNAVIATWVRDPTVSVSFSAVCAALHTDPQIIPTDSGGSLLDGKRRTPFLPAEKANNRGLLVPMQPPGQSSSQIRARTWIFCTW
jgi:hypothetical protein